MTYDGVVDFARDFSVYFPALLSSSTARHNLKAARANRFTACSAVTASRRTDSRQPEQAGRQAESFDVPPCRRAGPSSIVDSRVGRVTRWGIGRAPQQAEKRSAKIRIMSDSSGWMGAWRGAAQPQRGLWQRRQRRRPLFSQSSPSYSCSTKKAGRNAATNSSSGGRLGPGTPRPSSFS